VRANIAIYSNSELCYWAGPTD